MDSLTPKEKNNMINLIYDFGRGAEITKGVRMTEDEFKHAGELLIPLMCIKRDIKLCYSKSKELSEEEFYKYMARNIIPSIIDNHKMIQK